MIDRTDEMKIKMKCNDHFIIIFDIIRNETISSFYLI